MFQKYILDNKQNIEHLYALLYLITLFSILKVLLEFFIKGKLKF